MMYYIDADERHELDQEIIELMANYNRGDYILVGHVLASMARAILELQRTVHNLDQRGLPMA